MDTTTPTSAPAPFSVAAVPATRQQTAPPTHQCTLSLVGDWLSVVAGVWVPRLGCLPACLAGWLAGWLAAPASAPATYCTQSTPPAYLPSPFPPPVAGHGGAGLTPNIHFFTPRIFETVQLKHGYMRVTANATSLRHQVFASADGAPMDDFTLHKPPGWRFQPRAAPARGGLRGPGPRGAAAAVNAAVA